MVDPTVEFGKTIHDRLKELREEGPGLEEVTGYLEVNDSRLSRLILYLRSTRVFVALREEGPGLEEVTGYLEVNDSGLSRFIFYLRSTRVFVALRGVQSSLIVVV